LLFGLLNTTTAMACALKEKLRAFNKRHGKDTSGESPLNKERTKDEEELLKETYLKFKGNDKKYGAIPKFYSKVGIFAP